MRRVKQTLRIALISSLLFALALYALCLFFPTQLAAFFANHDRAVIALGAAGIVLYFSSLPFSALNTVIMYYFQSIEQGRCATLLALLKGTLFAFIGMALLYALFQENGIWLTITFAEGVRADPGMDHAAQDRQKLKHAALAAAFLLPV